MPENKKISEFLNRLAEDLDGTEFLGGYKTNGEDPNTNIQINAVGLIVAIIEAVGIPSWSEVLAQDANSGANSPIIDNGRHVDFQTLIGVIMKFAGGGELHNIAGNLFFKTPTIGMSQDGTSYTGQWSQTGDIITRRNQAASFRLTAHYAITYASSATWSWIDGNNATLVLTGDCSLTMTVLPTTANLFLTQAGAGGHAFEILNAVKWPDDTEPTWSTEAGKTDMISLISDGTNIVATAIIGYEL